MGLVELYLHHRKSHVESTHLYLYSTLHHMLNVEVYPVIIWYNSILLLHEHISFLQKSTFHKADSDFPCRTFHVGAVGDGALRGNWTKVCRTEKTAGLQTFVSFVLDFMGSPENRKILEVGHYRTFVKVLLRV